MRPSAGPRAVTASAGLRAPTPSAGLWTLTVFETRRLLRGPLLWGAAALCLGLRLYAVHEWLPDLTIDPVSMSGAMLLLAAAAMLAAHLAVSRDTREGMPESLGPLPGRAPERTAAAVVAVVAVSAGIAALTMALYLAARLAMGPVAGTFDPYEALAGVLAVPFAAGLGAVLGRWAPWPVAVPAAVFLLGAFTWLNGNQGGYGGWFLPVVLFHGPDWPARPSGLHVPYLVAAVVLFAALALLRHGVRPARLAAAVTAAAVAVPAGAVATAAAPGRAEMNPSLPVGTEFTARLVPAPVRDRYFGPDSRRCEKRGAVTYCAFPEYVSWIPLWASAVEPVVEALPPAARGRLPAVRQYSDSWWMAEDHDERFIGTFMMWGRAGARDAHRTALAARLINRFTRLEAPTSAGCDGRGQARTVVGLWLLGQVAPPAPAVESELQIGGSLFEPRLSPLGAAGYGAAELGYARELLATPGARERIWAHWDTLLAPGTTIERALPLLGLRPAFAPEPVRGTPCS
ncbi:hypothetical protein AB0D67_21270 [Streptosporangium sp. NPDC048047]|uniref:hypothetical protein n=1 Tax=Streptosporangium sp. NPDC048047 TaxID=3155748 RepID=UPI00341BDDA0